MSLVSRISEEIDKSRSPDEWEEIAQKIGKYGPGGSGALTQEQELELLKLLETHVHERGAQLEVHSMANVPQRVYRLPLAPSVKFNILQPGDLRLNHAPRLKVFMKNPRTGPNFSISLTKDPVVVAGESFLSAKDLKLVLEHVAKYHEAYLALWNDDGLDIDDLREKMDAIDKGGSTS